MTKAERIREKKNAIAEEYFGRPAVSRKEKMYLNVLLLQSIFTGMWRIVNARMRLRKCITGNNITVRGKLKMQSRGTIKIGNNCSIWSHIGTTQISAGPRAVIEIGNNTFINTGTIISARRLIKIGNNCQIANQVIMMDNDFHGVDNRETSGSKESIVIEDNVWLATRVMVLKGVTIGKGAVVAAGAVVTKNIPPYTLAGGVPAKVIRSIKKPDICNS